MNDIRFARIAGSLALAAGLVCASHASAVGTRYFSLDSAAVLSDGKLEGTAVLSSGAVVPSVGTRRIALENTPIARSLLVGKDGAAYVGSGNDGKIWKLTADVPTLFCDTEALLVTSLAMDAAGTLYAGTMPKGVVLAIDAQGKSRQLAKLPGAEQVWGLAFDEKKKLLYAATGPEGKIFSIDAKGKAEVFYDSEASHVMALVLGDDGALYAGTSDEALLLKLTAPGRAEVVFDFEGNEVTAIALQGGQIAVAANLFARPAQPPKKDGKKDDQKSDDKTEVNKDQPKPGKGHVWVLTPGGTARKLFSSEQGHITAVQWAEDGAVYVATGKDGQIYRVAPTGSSALWIDVDERQVLALDLRAAQPMFVTADAGAIYRVLPGVARDATWTSKVLDAQSLSRFGELTFRARGKVSLQTRSGNTDKPDATWSEWSSVLDKPGPVRSPAARFLQLRAKLGVEPAAELYAVTVYYAPQNQAAQVTEVTVKPKHKGKDADDAEPSSVYAIEWKSDNPDGDKLRYRLAFRPEGQDTLRSIERESETLTRASYDWQTEALPDGYYRVRVEASDELVSPKGRALMTSAESEPFLVDNHKPSVEGLRVDKNVLRGTAKDAQGPITALELAIDGRDFEPITSVDGILDTASESFEVELPTLAPGKHVVAVRAADARGNRSSSEAWITIK